MSFGAIYLRELKASFLCTLAGNYMFKVNNRNTRTRCDICSKLTIKIPERRQWLGKICPQTRPFWVMCSWYDEYFIRKPVHPIGRRFHNLQGIKQRSQNTNLVFNSKKIKYMLSSTCKYHSATNLMTGNDRKVKRAEQTGWY